MQKQLYGIAIFEEEIVLSDFTLDVERRYVVTPDQLAGFIRSEMTFRPFPGLVWMKTDGSSETYLFTFPAQERVILKGQWEGEGREIVPLKLKLPTVAVRARVAPDTRTVCDVDMWAFAGEELLPETILYQLPLPNLSRSRLCLGSNKWPVEQDVRAAIEQAAFDGTFIHHNGIVSKDKLPFPAYVEKHGGEVPLETLHEIGRGRDILGGSR